MNPASHLKILAVFLALAGLGLTLYQIFALGTPLREGQLSEMWTVDARISFNVPEARAVELQMALPPLGQAYEISNELFIASGYGQTLLDSGESRTVHWTARKVSGQQTLFYRFNLAKAAEAPPAPPGETWRSPIPVQGNEKIAVDAIIAEIRQKSVDTVSFISTTAARLNDARDDNVRLLLKGDDSAAGKMRVLEVILSQAHIPMQLAHTLRLADGGHEPELWARSYIEVDKEQKAGWYYFNFETFSEGLPKDRLLWWTGDGPMIKSPSGVRPKVDLQLSNEALPVISLQKLSQGRDFTLYSLPLSTQFAYRLMLMIPFGVFIILLLRNVVGLDTLGTFTPVLIALAFRETGLGFGLIFFSLIISGGLLLRAYLEQLRLQMLPRLSVVLTCVILLIIGSSMLSFKLGFSRGLSITLFPMVILTMCIERLSVTWEERGGAQVFRVAVGTAVAASCVYAVLDLDWLAYLVFTFPGILLVIMAVMLGLGRYSGYRLSELVRFQALLGKGQ